MTGHTAADLWPLAEAKLAAPRQRSGLVERPRILEVLDAGADATLTLVAAPPGFGKSTAVRAWCARRNEPLAWVTLDARDNDPPRPTSRRSADCSRATARAPRQRRCARTSRASLPTARTRSRPRRSTQRRACRASVRGGSVAPGELGTQCRASTAVLERTHLRRKGSPRPGRRYGSGRCGRVGWPGAHQAGRSDWTLRFSRKAALRALPGRLSAASRAVFQVVCARTCVHESRVASSRCR